MIISLQVPQEMAARYDELARDMGSSRDHIMVDALFEYLEAEQEDRRITQMAIAGMESGLGIPFEEIEAEDIAWLDSRGFTPEQIAYIDKQVDEELRAYYGVAPCE